MIPVLTTEEMKEVDRIAISGNLEIGMKYMHKASRGLFDLIISEILKGQKKGVQSRTVVLAGSGNNGGDGILLASHLIEEGYPCICFVLGAKEKIKGEAKKALGELLKTKADSCFFIESIDKLYLIQEHLNFIASSSSHAFIIDALIGIGFKGALKDPIKRLTEIINNYNKAKTIIAVDSPSGVNNDTAEISSAPIKADLTLSMGFPKLASFFYPGRAFYGYNAIHALSYPEEIVRENHKSQIFFLNQVNNLIPPRQVNGSKYDHGIALLIAGAKGMHGAAALSAKAALKSGLGMLHLLSDSEDLIGYCPEAITHKLSNSYDENLKIIHRLEKNFQVISIGPGLGKSHAGLVRKLVTETSSNLILDADGINAFEDQTKCLKGSKSEILLTPHEGEFLRLFPNSFNRNSKPLEKIEALRKKAKKLNINILLKGTPNILADREGRVYIIPFGNSALATAGTGDVLTGLITGFAAQKLLRPNYGSSKLVEAALLACYLHAKAGEAASQDLTEYCVTASDVINYLPKVLKPILI